MRIFELSLAAPRSWQPHLSPHKEKLVFGRPDSPFVIARIPLITYTTMTTPALALGSALVAFGPFLALFSMIVYQKAQLVIVVTTAAFCFLLGSTAGAFCWRIFDWIGFYGPLAAMIPSVLAQFLARCGFVALYHRVEGVIKDSLEKEEDDTRPSSQSVVDNTNQSSEKHWAEVAKMRLQLNDAACGIAAGVGFGGMHSILLYGTLLASEMSTNVGVLYQDSCPAIPSLAVSAVYALCFFVLDMFWMLFTFFGMRRRLTYHRGQGDEDTLSGPGTWMGNSRVGGNLALVWVLLTHFAAAVLTTADFFKNGCYVSVPAVGGVVLFTAYLYWAGIGRIYMPADQLTNERMQFHHYNRDVGSMSDYRQSRRRRD